MNKEQVRVKESAVHIPHTIDLWDYKAIGAYLKRSPEVVRERIAPIPGFPRPVRIPSVGAGRTHALYKAREVIAWAEGHST